MREANKHCENPDCNKLIPWKPGVKPSVYAKIKACSEPCRRIIFSLKNKGKAKIRKEEKFVMRSDPALHGPDTLGIDNLIYGIAYPVTEAMRRRDAMYGQYLHMMGR